MRTAPTTKNTEGTIWTRVVNAETNDLPPEAARVFLRFAFKSEDRRRMRELAAKARAGKLSPSEREEIANYERVGAFLSLLKAKARRALKRGSK